MNNALFLNVSEWSFFCFGVYLFLSLFIFIIFFALVFNCFFSTIKKFFLRSGVAKDGDTRGGVSWCHPS